MVRRWTSFWLHNSTENTLSNIFENQSRCGIINKIVKSARSRIAILADKIICNHHLHNNAKGLHRSGDFSERRSSTFRTTRNTKATTHVMLKTYLQIQQQQQQQQPQQPKLEDDTQRVWYLRKPSSSARRYEARHGRESNEATGATHFWSERWYSSHWKKNSLIRMQKTLKESKLVRTRFVFEKTLRKRRWCSAKNPAKPFSKWAMWSSWNWRNIDSMTILSSLRNWRNLSLPCGKLLKLDLDAINRFKEAPFRASPNLYKKCQMWTKSMAIPSPQSSWRISKRYKSRAKIYVNLMRLTKNLCLSIIGRMLGFDNSVSSTMRRNSNENEICIHFTYAVLTTTNKHCLCHSDQILVSKRAIKKVAPFIPVSEKKRLHNKIDPSLQEYFEWLSRNKEDYFAEEHHQPSSSSSWSPTSCGALLHGLRTGKDGINTVGKTTDGQSNGEWNNLEFAFLRSRKRNQTTTSRKLSTTTKSLVSTIFSTELLNLSFALSQKATDVSATGCADTIPTQTYANTHFFLVHAPQRMIRTFPVWEHRVGWKWKRVCVTCSSALFSLSLDMSLLNVPTSRFPRALSSPTCLTSQTSATSTSFSGRRNNPCASARLSGMSGRMAREHPAAASKPQLAEFPPFFWIFRCESLEIADWVGWQSCEHTSNWCLWG